MSRRIVIDIDLPRLLRFMDRVTYADVPVERRSDELYMVNGVPVGIYPGFREELRENVSRVMSEVTPEAEAVGINAFPLSLLLLLVGQRMGPALPFAVARYEILLNPSLFGLTIARTRYGYMVVIQ